MMDDPMFVIEHGGGRYRLQLRIVTGWLVFAIYLLALLAPVFGIIVLRLHPMLHISVFVVGSGDDLAVLQVAKPRSKIIDLDAVERVYEAFVEWRKQHGSR